MLDSIQEAGCEFPQNFFTCAPCPNHISGGFRTPMNYEEGKMDDYVPNVLLFLYETKHYISNCW